MIEITKKQKPSDRGELEITDVNKEYLNNQKLRMVKMGRGFTWLDTGSQTCLKHLSSYRHWKSGKE